MSPARISLLLTAIIVAAALALTSCSRLPVYSHYESIGGDGWNRGDTVTFSAGVRESAAYSLRLGLRVNSHYPYTQLVLAVRCRDAAHLFDRTDTLTVDITDDQGTFVGRGTSLYQYDLRLPDIIVTAADTLTVSVVHCMNTPLLPGVTDVGITLGQ